MLTKLKKKSLLKVTVLSSFTIKPSVQIPILHDPIQSFRANSTLIILDLKFGLANYFHFENLNLHNFFLLFLLCKIFIFIEKTLLSLQTLILCPTCFKF